MSKTSPVILYIEDDPEARFLMADMMRYKGYTYLEASRALDGIKLAQKHKPDLILIDLILPDMQGYEVTTHLKSSAALQNTPIIALTAETQKNVKEMVLTAGCDGYIAKPINVSEFLFKIEEFLAGKREFVHPEHEKLFLQKYNVQLVSRLKKKITELEELNKNLNLLNQDLFKSQEELSTYNDRLFYLNSLANYLRTLNDPQILVEILPAKIVENFHLERCILFEFEQDKNILRPVSSKGISLSDLSRMKLKLSESFMQELNRQEGVLWIKDFSEILDPSLNKLASVLESNSFLLANLSNLGRRKEATTMLKKLTADLNDERIIRLSRRYLIFMDKQISHQTFATYEIRILKSFLQTVAIIYENMMLYSRMLDLYKIKAQEAIHDGLTKVYNYRYFIQELEREANRTKRFHTPFSLFMIDVDHFKQYNDKHGHQAGDVILREVARLLEENTRKTDTVARYGGEEFVVILPGLKKREATLIAQKLRELVANHTFEDAKHKPCCEIKISIGVAACPEDSLDPHIVLQMADKALYRAKDRGRNQVCIA